MTTTRLSPCVSLVPNRLLSPRAARLVGAAACYTALLLAQSCRSGTPAAADEVVVASHSAAAAEKDTGLDTGLDKGSYAAEMTTRGFLPLSGSGSGSGSGGRGEADHVAPRYAADTEGDARGGDIPHLKTSSAPSAPDAASLATGLRSLGSDYSLRSPAVLTDVECKKTVASFHAYAKKAGSHVITKRLKIGFLLTTEDDGDESFLFLVPVGILSSPSGGLRDGHSRCLDDGSYYDVLSQ